MNADTRYWYVLYEYQYRYPGSSSENQVSAFLSDVHPVTWLADSREKAEAREAASTGPASGWYDIKRLLFFHEISKEQFDRVEG